MKILNKIVKNIEERLSDINLKIELTEAARIAFVDNGFDLNYGARPLKRLVSRTIETDLAKMIIEGKIKSNDTVLVDYDDKFIIRCTN